MGGTSLPFAVGLSTQHTIVYELRSLEYDLRGETPTEMERPQPTHSGVTEFDAGGVPRPGYLGDQIDAVQTIGL